MASGGRFAIGPEEIEKLFPIGTATGEGAEIHEEGNRFSRGNERRASAASVQTEAP
jgi:hypothetical protein